MTINKYWNPFKQFYSHTYILIVIICNVSTYRQPLHTKNVQKTSSNLTNIYYHLKGKPRQFFLVILNVFNCLTSCVNYKAAMVTCQYSILFPRRCCALKSAFDALWQFTSPLCTPYRCTKLQIYNIIAQHHTIPMQYHTLSYGYKVKVFFHLCTNRLQEFLDHDWIRIRKAKEFILWILKVNPRSFMLMTQCQ